MYNRPLSIYPGIEQRRLNQRRQWRRWRKLGWSVCLCTVTCLVIWLGMIPIRLAITEHQYPKPQAILTLGGDDSRERYTAAFAQTHSDLEIWVSTGMNPEDAMNVFESFGIDQSRVYLDRRAIDTVTNFTTLVDVFQSRSIHHIFLITSDYHMRRAKSIASIVLGSQGIAFTPLAVPSSQPPESKLRITRDVFRAWLWVLTRRTAASLHPSQRRELLQATQS